MINTDRGFDLLLEYKPTKGFKPPISQPAKIQDHLKNLHAEKQFLRKKLSVKGANKVVIAKQLRSIEFRIRDISKDIASQTIKAKKRSHLKSIPGGNKEPLKPKGPKPIKKPSRFSPDSIRKVVKKATGKGRGRYAVTGIAVAIFIIALTQDLYAQRMSAAAKKCRNSSNKDQCMSMYRRLSYIARVKDLQRKKNECGKSDDRAACVGKVDQKISKIQARITRG